MRSLRLTRVLSTTYELKFESFQILISLNYFFSIFQPFCEQILEEYISLLSQQPVPVRPYSRTHITTSTRGSSEQN